MLQFLRHPLHAAQDIDAGVGIEEKHPLIELFDGGYFRLRRSLEQGVSNPNRSKEPSRPQSLALWDEYHPIAFADDVNFGTF